MNTQLSDNNVAAIKALLDKWIRSSLDADWEKMSDLLTEDVVFMPPDEPIIEGKEGCMVWFEKFPPINEFSNPLVRAEVRDDIACARGMFALTMEPEPGKPVSMKGKWFCTFRKQPDGTWLCASDIWNLDAPLAAR